jgi:hypothetical protein
MGNVAENLPYNGQVLQRCNVIAAVRAEVRMVLRRKGINAEQFQFILNSIMKQAEALYEDWPLAA